MKRAYCLRLFCLPSPNNFLVVAALWAVVTSLMSVSLLPCYTVILLLWPFQGQFTAKIRKNFLAVTRLRGQIVNFWSLLDIHSMHVMGSDSRGDSWHTHRPEQNSILSAWWRWSDLNYSWILELFPNLWSLCYLDISWSPGKLYLKFTYIYVILINLDSVSCVIFCTFFPHDHPPRKVLPPLKMHNFL